MHWTLLTLVQRFCVHWTFILLTDGILVPDFELLDTFLLCALDTSTLVQRFCKVTGTILGTKILRGYWYNSVRLLVQSYCAPDTFTLCTGTLVQRFCKVTGTILGTKILRGYW